MTIASVSASAWKPDRHWMKFVPMSGSPPIPIHVDWPHPCVDSWWMISYVRVPLRDTTPTRPGRQMFPGMMPTLLRPGEMSPGQLGPIRRAPRSCTKGSTRVMSSTGIPSVMQTISGIPASAASKMADAATAAGT